MAAFYHRETSEHFSSQVEAATAEEDGSPLFVVDETNLLTPSTEKYLDRLLKKLEDDTGLKLRATLSVYCFVQYLNCAKCCSRACWILSEE